MIVRGSVLVDGQLECRRWSCGRAVRTHAAGSGARIIGWSSRPGPVGFSVTVSGRAPGPGAFIVQSRSSLALPGHGESESRWLG
jgi:hypothetical protein